MATAPGGQRSVKKVIWRDKSMLCRKRDVRFALNQSVMQSVFGTLSKAILLDLLCSIPDPVRIRNASGNSRENWVKVR